MGRATPTALHAGLGPLSLPHWINAGLAFATTPEFDTETKLGVILGSMLSTVGRGTGAVARAATGGAVGLQSGIEVMGRRTIAARNRAGRQPGNPLAPLPGASCRRARRRRPPGRSGTGSRRAHAVGRTRPGRGSQASIIRPSREAPGAHPARGGIGRRENPVPSRQGNGWPRRTTIRTGGGGSPGVGPSPYFRCWARYLFISNIVALSLPKTFFSLSSARISRLFSGFWSEWVRM